MIYGTIGNGSNHAQEQSVPHSSDQHPHANPHGQHKPSQGIHEQQEGGEMPHQAISQIIGVAVLEFGVLLHSFVIGMTLAVVERFLTLFIVITLHRKSEYMGFSETQLTRSYHMFRDVRGSWAWSEISEPFLAEEAAMGAYYSWVPVCVYNASWTCDRPAGAKELLCRVSDSDHRFRCLGCLICRRTAGASFRLQGLVSG